MRKVKEDVDSMDLQKYKLREEREEIDKERF